MSKYGINTEKALGVSMPLLRQTAKKLGKSHSFALELWASGIHEARILACLVEEPALVSEDLAEVCVKDSIPGIYVTTAVSTSLENRFCTQEMPGMEFA
jgi:3-methyladenine DNA glycosylase AlkD